METAPYGALHELLSEQPPLDHAREAYLIMFNTRLGESHSEHWTWDEPFEALKSDYIRVAGMAAEKLSDLARREAKDLGLSESDAIENAIVDHVTSEASRRWIAYTSIIIAAGKETAFEETLPVSSSIVLDLVEKEESLRKDWKEFCLELAQAGEPQPDHLAPVQASFVKRKLIRDTQNESIFLRAVWRA